MLLFSGVLFAIDASLNNYIKPFSPRWWAGGDGRAENSGMTVKKISDSDKHDILTLYRQTGETTSTLAERYDVSNSTISRLLKSTLQEDEYEALISKKRAARTVVKDATQMPLFSDPEPDVSVADLLVADKNLDQPSTPASEELLQPFSAASQKETETLATAEALPFPDDAPSDITASSVTPFNEDQGSKRRSPPQRLIPTQTRADSSATSLNQDSGAQASALAQMLGEDLLDESEDLTDLDDDEDLEDLDEDDLDDDTPIVKRRLSAETLIQVLPLSEATLPKTCYLVIDRASELITRPLRDFGDLGQIPSQEFQQKTLPVFDNHRVARRFSTKRDRVIKVPDSRMLQKTRSHLQAKGITRLLVDGQVYSLSSN